MARRRRLARALPLFPHYHGLLPAGSNAQTVSSRLRRSAGRVAFRRAGRPLPARGSGTRRRPRPTRRRRRPQRHGGVGQRHRQPSRPRRAGQWRERDRRRHRHRLRVGRHLPHRRQHRRRRFHGRPLSRRQDDHHRLSREGPGPRHARDVSRQHRCLLGAHSPQLAQERRRAGHRGWLRARASEVRQGGVGQTG